MNRKIILELFLITILFSISSVYAENVNTTYSDGLSQTNHLDITNQIDEEGTNGLSEIGIQSRENSDIDDLEPSTTWVSENKEDTSINKLPEKKLIAKDTTLNAEIETNKVSLNNEYLTYNINETIKNNTIINKTKEDIKKVQEQVIRITTQVNTIYRRIIIINQKIETQQKNTNKQQTTKIIANKKTYKSKVKTKKYSITLKSGKKRLKRFKVYLTIKGKKYKKTFTKKTNTKGKAVFKIKKLSKKGKYTAKVTFKGTKNYKKANKKVKIIIK